METKTILCDICIDRVSKNKCDICGKDICPSCYGTEGFSSASFDDLFLFSVCKNCGKAMSKFRSEKKLRDELRDTYSKKFKDMWIDDYKKYLVTMRLHDAKDI